MVQNYDFSGWATRNDMKCSDGRTIRKDAFKHNDGQVVPLVWNHQHNDPLNVLGHALLENRENGVYAYCTLNDTPAGNHAREMVQHGDVSALSIYANHLKQQGGNVLHGAIREVSLVLAGANPGAFIDSIMLHGEESEEEAIIYSGDEELFFMHADEEYDDYEDEGEEEMADNEKTVGEVFDELTDEQKDVVYFMIEQALEEAEPEEDDEDEYEEYDEDEYDEGEDEDMKHNVFDMYEDDYMGDSLSHAEMGEIFADAKRYGSLRDAVIAHGIDEVEYIAHGEYGIDNIDYLFPDAKSLDNPPSWIKRPDEWVGKVMSGTHHTPFSRIKSMHANITEDEARAKGYIKGKKKKEEVFSLLKRTTSPTTIYKKQKLDRDDVIDITDFDVVSWLKGEMRMMLDEEIARAILVGDGRLPSDDDHINPMNIRPIYGDDDLYTIYKSVEIPAAVGSLTDAQWGTVAKDIIKAAIRARKEYRGSGNPVLFTTEDALTEMLLLEDGFGHPLYASKDKLATAMRVSAIHTVPVMGTQTRTDDDSKTHTLIGIIVNLNDYNVGADKGGSVNMFDDFDIDYNQQKYLIETRCSGALTVPYSAIAIETHVGE